MIVCQTCEQSKPEEEFYSGIRTHCRICWRARVKANRLAKADHYRAYDRARASQPERVSAREVYAKTPQGRDRRKVASKAWIDRNPDKRSAHNTLNNAVRDGTIARPSQCGRCGGAGIIHAHHPDYSRPLDVEWLCTTCHAAEHKEHE